MKIFLHEIEKNFETIFTHFKFVIGGTSIIYIIKGLIKNLCWIGDSAVFFS